MCVPNAHLRLCNVDPCVCGFVCVAYPQIWSKYFVSDALARYSSMGPAGFVAFEAVFRATNQIEGKLRQGSNLLVIEADVIGLDAVWSLAIQVRDSSHL